METTPEDSGNQQSPDWNDLHREHYAQRGRKVALGLIALSVGLFALVAVVVLIAG